MHDIYLFCCGFGVSVLACCGIVTSQIIYEEMLSLFRKK